MTDMKSSVKDAVEAKIVESTALAVAPKLAESSQLVLQKEMEASHLQSMGQMAIENAIDEDRAAYEGQLDEIRKATEANNKRINTAKAKFEAIVDAALEELKRTELRRMYAKAVASLNKIPNLSALFQVEPDSDDIHVERRLGVKPALAGARPKPTDAEKENMVGYIGWHIDIESVNHKNNYNTPKVRLEGTRSFGKKCEEAFRALKALEKDGVALLEVNREVRLKIQNLERERRELQRKLRQQIVSSSSVAKELDGLLKKNRKAVETLVLPARLKA